LDGVSSLIVVVLLIACSLLAIRLCEKHDIPLFLHRILLPNMHEHASKKWIEKRITRIAVRAKFTNAALKLIGAKCRNGCSVLIVPSYRYVRGRGGGLFLSYAQARLGAADSSEDFVSVESNAEISVLVARGIYEILRQENVPLIVTTSGFWKFRKLRLRHDLSWFLWRQETKGKAKRPYVVGFA